MSMSMPLSLIFLLSAANISSGSSFLFSMSDIMTVSLSGVL